VTRRSAATLGAAMKLLDESSQARIGRTRVLRVGNVHKLVTVVVHFHSTAWTNHLAGNFNHGILTFLDQSSDICSRPWRNVLAIQISSLKNLSMRRM